MIEIIGKNAIESVLDFLSESPEISQNDARFCLENSDLAVIRRDNSGQILGCGAFRLWGSLRDRADLYLYVRPGARRRGIGTELSAALTDGRCEELKFISTRIETGHQAAAEFFRAAGFEKWYSEVILRHSGARQPESKLKLTQYRGEYFGRYVDGLRRSFYELRSSNGFEPFYCCEPGEEKRAELEKNRDNIFVLLDGEKLAASVMITPDSIEDVFVVPEYQGKGMGRELMRFAVNKALDGGGQIRLSAIEWNTRALNLYESVGFKPEKRIDFMRKFL